MIKVLTERGAYNCQGMTLLDILHCYKLKGNINLLYSINIASTTITTTTTTTTTGDLVSKRMMLPVLQQL